MKIITLLLLLASLSGGCFLSYTLQRVIPGFDRGPSSKKNMSPRWSLSRALSRGKDDTLATIIQCKKQTEPILEQQLKNHDASFACTNVHSIYVKNPWGDLGIKADYATFTPKPKLLTLMGNVTINYPQGIVTTDEANFAFDTEALSCKGNVKTEACLSPAHTRPQ